MTSRYYRSRYSCPNPIISLRDANNFTLTLVSAENLPCIQRSGRKTEVYAKVSLDGAATKKSDVDIAGESNPTRDFQVSFPISESTHNTGGNLVVYLYYKRILGRTFIGEVRLNVKSLFDKWVDCERGATETVVGCNDNNGRLKIKYHFGISG